MALRRSSFKLDHLPHFLNVTFSPLISSHISPKTKYIQKYIKRTPSRKENKCDGTERESRISYRTPSLILSVHFRHPPRRRRRRRCSFFFFPPSIFIPERTNETKCEKKEGKNQRWNVQPHRHLPFSRPACVKEKELVSLTIPIFNLNTQSIYINIRIRFFFCCCFVFRSNSGRWTWRRIIKRADERVHTQNVQPFFGCGTVH